MEVQRYPLQWPVGWKRNSAADRKWALFRVETGPSPYLAAQTGQPQPRARSRSLTVSDALRRLVVSLGRLGATNEVVSTNVVLRLDGLPRSGQGEPRDPGAAVYFTLKGKPRCLACDRWTRVADNIAAIAAHIEAIRAVDRYGVGTMDQAFAGYAQLQSGPDCWWLVLNIPEAATLEQAEAAYRKMARTHHPDAGGTQDGMARLNQAMQAARAALGGADNG